MTHKIYTVTVCMATYNGEKYIVNQLNSIINQSYSANHIIVSDDFSQDKTVDLVEILLENHKEKKIIKNKINLQHVKNFERALLNAKGDIIFLSDQDDIWKPEKIERVVGIFEKNPKVAMVHHNLTTVNENLDFIKENYVNLNKTGIQDPFVFLFSEFFKPRLFGCAMAFRKDILDILLPFPSCVYAHDHWISIVSALSGDIYFFDENLVYYRQHNNNLTPKNRRSLLPILKSRFLFGKMILIAIFRNNFILRLK
jgi:glycosyltransferase involved in cell wall biosynthesis